MIYRIRGTASSPTELLVGQRRRRRSVTTPPLIEHEFALGSLRQDPYDSRAFCAAAMLIWDNLPHCICSTVGISASRQRRCVVETSLRRSNVGAVNRVWGPRQRRCICLSRQHRCRMQSSGPEETSVRRCGEATSKPYVSSLLNSSRPTRSVLSEN